MTVSAALPHLQERFSDAILDVIDFMGETTVEIKNESLISILTFLKQAPEPGFQVLMDLTGVDYLEPSKRTKLVYLLHNPANLSRLRITLFAARDEAVPSVISLWRGAAWYERELFDLFGVQFEGHPNLRRLLMPDDWKGHPLRRDYALTEEPVQFKHGVKPKVPSEIIPYVKRDRKK